MTLKNKKDLLWNWALIILLISLFIYLISNMNLWEQILKTIYPKESTHIYPRANLLILIKEHLFLTIASSFLAVLAGILIGIFVTRPIGSDYRQIVNDIASLAQTFPPVAVLALAVPFLGFGFAPTITALFLYSILPVIRNTISGIQSISPQYIDAAKGMGMGRIQILLKVELPLSLRVIIAGIRISIIINIGTATLGAVVGAGGLGTPIISGLIRDNPSFVLEGAIAAALLALIVDLFIAQIETSLTVY